MQIKSLGIPVRGKYFHNSFSQSQHIRSSHFWPNHLLNRGSNLHYLLTQTIVNRERHLHLPLFTG